MRAEMPDAFLSWLDAALVLASEDPKYPPLLGTGGNDGRLEFTNNFMQNILRIMDPETGTPTKRSPSWLKASLWGKTTAQLEQSAIGFFAPGMAGGFNATTGFEISKSPINPWDFVLMLEGALAFAAAATTRQNATSVRGGNWSYPFTVRASSAQMGLEEAKGARGEFWAPLWQRPARFAELQVLFAEGRAVIGRRQARDGLDFVRAVHQLGVDRGLSSFVRFAFVPRFGRNYFAVPLARVRVRKTPQSEWLQDLEQGGWLDRFRAWASGKNAPAQAKMLTHRLENKLFSFVQFTSPTHGLVQEVLVLLAEIQDFLSRRLPADLEGRSSFPPPVPRLALRWGLCADDGSAAFRMARALASVAASQGMPPLVAHLFPLHPKRLDRWHAEFGRWVPWRGDAVRWLREVARERARIMEANEGARLVVSGWGVGLGDIASFLQGDAALDAALSRLLPALSLVDWGWSGERTHRESGAVPAGWALLALALSVSPRALQRAGVLPENAHPPRATSCIGLLAGHQPQAAMRAARRALVASGMRVPRLNLALGASCTRSLAALLVPLAWAEQMRLIEDLLADAGQIPTEEVA